MVQNLTSNPPHYFKLYKSNIDRAPRKKFIKVTDNIIDKGISKKFSKNFKINNNLLVYKKNRQPLGQKIIISGRITNSLGNILEGIIIEIWQAIASGKYRDNNDEHNAPIDPNFFGYGVTKTDKLGRYKFKTILPGAYPWKNHKNAWRPRHIHFSLLDTSIFSRLCTQMYFPDDILLKFDPIYNSIPSKYRKKLISSFDNKKNIVPNYLSFKFDIVM
jgi:protocatechuate 3,4-dioxygenase beta subunit